MNVLVTGGAGFIGSHTVVELVQEGHCVTILDNFCNSSRRVLDRLAQVCGERVDVIEGDVRDAALLRRAFAAQQFDAVLHFAGLKAVGESVEQPLAYYDNNVGGSVTLCQAMAEAGVFRLIFSSSATVYGDAERMPIEESFPTGRVTNPYGRSKWMVEEILKDLAASDPRWAIGILRYFNPVGAHPSGLLGEDPRGIPNNLVPYVAQVAVGKLDCISVYGDCYPTRDGTGVRDYIHVVDLARGHLKALAAIMRKPGVNVWNLGRGEGYSVLDVIRAFERACGKLLPYRIVAPRPGDVAECWAATEKAWHELGWRAEYDLDAMMRDAWRWQESNPRGYDDQP